ncbi:MAG: hypothetical protein HQ510_05480 [Candidatus Marinimicrobia bacterium]|nr:hypothetical protein [Candidatus Neomarinimicrobiota bacterium]
MVGVVIVAIACVGIMMGTVHARGELRRIQIEEFAMDHLVNYMEYWKGRVASGTVSSVNLGGDFAGKTIFLLGYHNPVQGWNEDEFLTAKLYYDIDTEPSIHDPNPPFKRFRITTWIEWQDHVYSREDILRKKQIESVMTLFDL